MDINFPLVLVVLVFASGVIGLYDWLFLRKKRLAAVAVVDAQFQVSAPGEPADLSRHGAAYEQAKMAAVREPVVVEYAKSFFPVLFVVLILRSFLVEPFQIPSASMVPTLEVGDFILVNKFTYGIRLPVVRNKVIEINRPERGDVMVFFPPHKPMYFIKRVVGLPGDKVEYINNTLYINGEMMVQQHVASLPPYNPQYHVMRENIQGVEHAMQKNVIPSRYSVHGSWVVPEGHYFLMGDNRDNSSDSRDWGPVPEENIVGKAFAIWMHWESFFSLPKFHRVGAIE